MAKPPGTGNGADLEGTGLEYLDRITDAGNKAVSRQNRVLGASAERLVGELSGIYGKIQTRGTGNFEAQQVNARLKNLGDLLKPQERADLVAQMKGDLAAAEGTGRNSSKELSKLLGATGDTLKQNAKPNLPAIDNAGKRLNDFWAKENTLFRDRVTAMTQAAAAEGKSWRKLAGDVRKLLLLEQKAGTESARSTRVNARLGVTARAELIARTEMQTAYINGQLSQYREMGYEWVRWSATAERSCPFCISRDGLLYEIGDADGAIPAHPRCRCSLIPAEPPPNFRKKPRGKQGVEAAESLDDAYWARSRAKKIQDFRKNNPQFTNSELRRYVRTPTNSQAYLRPGTPAPEPVWAPSGTLSPNLEQVVLNAAAAAKAIEQQAAAATKAKEQKRLEDEAKALEKEKELAEKAKQAEEVKEDKSITPKKGDTVNRYSNARKQGEEPGPNTRWTPERAKLHQEIIDKFLASGVAVKNPKFTMSGGGPASGKGYMLEKVGITKDGKPKKGQVVIDSDEIKKLLPDYKEMVRKGGKTAEKAASYVHEESSYLAKRIMAEAGKRKFNVVLDGTGDNGIKSLAKKVKGFRDMGYKVEAIYVSADTNTAALRNWERFIKTSRLPPEWMLRNVHADVSRTLPQAMSDKLFDKVTLYDTNLSGDMRLVASAGKRGPTKVHNQQLWDDFQKKGKTQPLTRADEPRLIASQIERAKAEGRPIEPQKPIKSLAKGPDTVGKHSSQRTGGDVGQGVRWSAERAKLHQEIVDSFLENGIKRANPTFTMSGGGPASGKGFMLKQTGLDKKGTVVVDSDEIKKLLPEYREMQAKGGKAGKAAAAFVHEESSYLSKRIMAEAGARRFDVVLDGTGDNGIRSLTKKVEGMRSKGYRVEAKYVSADTELAAQRNWDRFTKTGRLPPEWMLRNVHADVSRTLPEAMKQGLFDKVELFDTNQSGKLRPVARSSKGKALEVQDKQLWDDFKKKGKAKQLTKDDEPQLITVQKTKAAKEGRATTFEDPSKPVKSLTRGPDTVGKHSSQRAGGDVGKDVRWSAERAKLHQEIVDKFLDGGIKRANPTFTMSGGGPASGKGFMLKQTGLDKKGTVVVDSDEIKKLLPEYREMQAKGGKAGKQAAAFVHEESSYLSKRIMAEAGAKRYDVVLDGTGDNGIRSLTKKVEGMRSKGYRVEAKYVSADTELAAQRNWDRFTKTGRLPPEWMLRNVHADVSRTLPQAMKDGLFDKVELFDTNQSGKLRPVARSSKGKALEVQDKKLWDDFQKKGNAELLTKADEPRLITVQKTKAAKEGRATSFQDPNKAPTQAPIADRVGRMDVAKIKADPARFQYKLNANSKTGEVGSLKGVQKWNEDLAGVVSVWKDPANGQTYVINGHNRLALAQKLGVKDMPVLRINAKNAAEARAIGAKQNIANGDGTAIDAAKFMRDSKLTAADMKRAGLNLKGKVANDGSALANLPDHVFKAAVEGRLPIAQAAAIGRSGLNATQMGEAYKVVQSRPKISPGALDEVLLQARASSTRSKTETNLFGTSKVQTSTMLERAELAAKIKSDMARTVRTLDKAAGRSDVLAAKGNRIDVTKAQVKAAEAQARADVFDLQKNRPSSPVAKALNTAAGKIQDATGRSAKAAATKEGRTLVEKALDAEVAKMTSSSKGQLRSIADLKAKQAGKAAQPPELALAQAPPDVTSSQIRTRLMNPETAKAGSIGSLRPDQILADAKRFQYKAATDAKTGEVGSLEGVRRYDPELGGVLTVWKDPRNGKTYVINGHNRLAAAKRLGADAVSVRYINARTSEEARAMGALANIAEGQGTAIDAAKFMRSQKLTGDDMRARGVPLKKDVARDGAALANLPEELFNQVVNEKLSIDKGAIIGRSGLDAEGMRKVAQVVAKRPSTSSLTVKELVDREVQLMKQGTTGNLFGNTEDAGYQLERAGLTRGVRDGLLGEKSLFRTLSTSRAAKTLEGAGSEVNLDANTRAAAEADQVIAVFDQLKNVSGPVNQALNSGAARLQNATNATERLQIRNETQKAVVEAVQGELGRLTGAPPPPPPEAPGQVSLFG